jgi:hypothetical protein
MIYAVMGRIMDYDEYDVWFVGYSYEKEEAEILAATLNKQSAEYLEAWRHDTNLKPDTSIDMNMGRWNGYEVVEIGKIKG